MSDTPAQVGCCQSSLRVEHNVCTSDPLSSLVSVAVVVGEE